MNFSFDRLAWVLQIFSCFYMTGVILIIQRIHYPSFRMVDRKHFVEFHACHTQALGWVVGPVMCIELVTAFWLARSGNAWLVANLLGTILLWAITFAVSVPYHNRLTNGFDEKSWQGLKNTNWWRTSLWSLRSFAFLIFLSQWSL